VEVRRREVRRCGGCTVVGFGDVLEVMEEIAESGMLSSVLEPAEGSGWLDAALPSVRVRCG